MIFWKVRLVPIIILWFHMSYVTKNIIRKKTVETIRLIFISLQHEAKPRGSSLSQEVTDRKNFKLHIFSADNFAKFHWLQRVLYFL